MKCFRYYIPSVKDSDFILVYDKRFIWDYRMGITRIFSDKSGFIKTDYVQQSPS